MEAVETVNEALQDVTQTDLKVRLCLHIFCSLLASLIESC